MKNHPLALLSITACIVLIIDQLSKALAQQAGRILMNTGVSFGLLSDSIHLKTSLFVGALLLFFLLGYRVWRDFPVFSGFFWGGAISNVVDRLAFGAVRDWLPTPAFSLTNNFADWSIAVGSLLVAWSVIRANKESHVSR